MTDIDDEALAKAGWRAMFPTEPQSWENEEIKWRIGSRSFARAVIAAYRTQQRARGVVEISRETLEILVGIAEGGADWDRSPQTRLRAIEAGKEALYG